MSWPKYHKRTYTEITLGGEAKLAQIAKNYFANPQIAPKGGAETVNSKHLASWISGTSISYFKGTQTVQLPFMYYALPLLQTKIAEKNNCF